MGDGLIAKEDMDQVSAAKTKVTLAITQAEKVAAEAKIANLEYQNLVQGIFIKYGLKVNDRIDENTGKIIRAETEKKDGE